MLGKASTNFDYGADQKFLNSIRIVIHIWFSYVIDQRGPSNTSYTNINSLQLV